MVIKLNNIIEVIKRNSTLIIFVIITLAIGFGGSLLGGNNDIYEKINTPSFAPPAWLFPVVWTILYIAMGYSAYLVYNERDYSSALYMYFLQLAVNSLWNLFFFRLNWFGFSAIWLALLVICVAAMIYLFSLNNKKAAYIQIPYLIWTGFAFALNLSIYYLNL